MKRQLEGELLQWKEHQSRKPLILKGARQVGKTYLVEAFGKAHFQNLVSANFERQPSLCQIFSGTLAAGEVIQKLEAVLGTRIAPPHTLLFFDEIQRCPLAITALRYLYEERPELAVIAAGSLLDFALEKISVPVGRVTYLYLHPLSFREFLLALGEEPLISYLDSRDGEPVDAPIHNKLIDLVKKYALVGGMPEAINTYLTTQSFPEVGRVHLDLIESFRQDFSKYAPQARYPQLLKVLESTPKAVGRQIKYSHLDPESRSQETKQAVLLLERAQVIQRVRATSGQGLPLAATASDKVFKLVLLDIGLMQTLCGLPWGWVAGNQDFTSVNGGALAEQFVGQELLASRPAHETQGLYYWRREERGSSAEVDYVLPLAGSACPLEVKSAASGRLKSLHLFCQQYQPKKAFVVSSQPRYTMGPITGLPFYDVGGAKLR